MISEGLVLCFKDAQPRIISIINLGSNLVEFIFLLWGVGGNSYGLEYSALALYIIGMIFKILSYSIFIAIHLIILNKDQSNYLILNKVGKILCSIALLPNTLGFLFIFIASIILMAYYNSPDALSLTENGTIPSKFWAAAIIPFILNILITFFTVFCLNALYYVFDKYTVHSNVRDVRIENRFPQNDINNNMNTLEKPNVVEKPNASPYNTEMNPIRNDNNNDIDSRNNLSNNLPSVTTNNQNIA